MTEPTFLFVTGIHRSGTSPLHRCLRNHPAISGFQNTGVSEDEGQHLQTVLPRAGIHGGPGRFGLHPEAHMTEKHPLAQEATAQELFAQWKPYWDLSKPYLMEKSPPTLLRTRLFQALFPNSAFVVILRHPGAVALATLKGVQGLTLTDLIENWLICHEIFLADAPLLARLVVIKYEDLVIQPQSTLSRIYSVLGLEPYPCGERMNPDLNEHYAAQWQTISHHPAVQQDIEKAMRLEERIRSFGYTLEDWNVWEPLQGLS